MIAFYYYFFAFKRRYERVIGLCLLDIHSPGHISAKQNKVESQGEIPSPVNVPKGCSFNTRCRYATDRCFQDDPVMREIEPDHCVRCHLAGE